ncbi:MAG: LytTR family transcriptional regulator DNA-binding domain-containing protein [Lachnospiraceae bacterium]|nr:LytTR family transcriptional regulator DNA-binding domain-containing protein [Lachnospiraceae bacterium]
MKVNIYKEDGLNENYINLYYDKMDTETEIAKAFLLSFQKNIIGKDRVSEKERMILPGEILYLEMVDRKCFLYLKDSEWQTDATLQGFLDRFGNQGFVRISKSMVVNIFHIRELKAEANMRVNAILKNGEVLTVNRSYRNAFYKYLRTTKKGDLS